MLDPVTSQRWIFGGQVPDCLMKRWHATAGEQVICEVEAYALAITLFGLRGFLTGRCPGCCVERHAQGSELT